MRTITVALPSATFVLRESPDTQFYVIDVSSYNANALALMGQPFAVGRNPWEWDSGYPQRIQKQLNQEVNRE